MINAGDNAKLKIEELTGVKFAIVAPGSQLQINMVNRKVRLSGSL